MSAGDERTWKLADLNYDVPEHAERFGYGIGGLVLVGFILQIVTGVIIAFFYTPTVDDAWGSLSRLISSPVGFWIRSFHRWTAETVIFLVILHVSRIVFTASYRGKRIANWLFGIGLFIVTAAFFLSGSIVKWDQEGFEAYQHLVESTEKIPLIGSVLASGFKGATALMRVFAVHTLVLPVLLVVFLVPHLALMKLNGLSPLPGNSSGRVSSFFVHLKKVLGFSMIIYGVVAFLAAQFPPALLPAPYMGIELTKPPWILLFLYPLENWIGLLALFIVPLIVLAGLIAIPLVDRRQEINSTVRKVIVWGWIFAVAVIVFLTIYGSTVPLVSHFGM